MNTSGILRILCTGCMIAGALTAPMQNVYAAETTADAEIVAESSDLQAAETEAAEIAESEIQVESVHTSVYYGGVEYDPSITELDLSGRALTPEGLEELKAAVAQLPNLQTLILCDCGLSNETLGQLREDLPGVKVVWRLKLGSKWSLRTDAVAFSVLIYAYDYPRMTTDDIRVLQYCTDLRALDLGHQAITDLSPIGDYLPELRLLILADNQISDLTPLTKLTHLHYLELFVNRLTDISPLRELHELVDVNVSYNAIADLSPLLYSPMMERLWFEHTSAGEATFAMLQQQYPNAKIVLYGTGSVDQGWRTHERYYQMMDMWFNNYYGDTFSKFDAMAEELGLNIQTGDLDADGSVTLSDAMQALQFYTALSSGSAVELSKVQQKASDVNADGALTISDVQIILQYYTWNYVAEVPTTWADLIEHT